MPAMPRTPRPLTSALAAALAAGTVVAVGAVADPGPDRPGQASAARGWRMAPPPTRADAIRDAATARDELEATVAEELGVEPARVRSATRAVLARRLDEEVDAERLTAAQRDALLTCFDDPTGCDRGALPTSRLPGGAPQPYALGSVAPVEVLTPRRLSPAQVKRLRRNAQRRAAARKRAAQRRAVARKRAARRRGTSPRPARPVPPRPAPRPLLAGPADLELARELGVEPDALARALRVAAKATAGRPPRLDPDGVPLGLGTVGFLVPATPAFGPTLVVPPRPPRPARPPVTQTAPPPARLVPATPPPASKPPVAPRSAAPVPTTPSAPPAPAPATSPPAPAPTTPATPPAPAAP